MALTVSVDEIVQGSRSPLLAVRPHWKRIRLGEVASVLNGFAFKSTQFTKGKGMPLIRIRDVGSDSTDTNYVGEFDARYTVEPSDLLIGMDGDFNCARWRGPCGLLNQRVCKVSLHTNEFHPRFLDFVLPGYLKAINQATSSVTVKHLSSRTVEDIPLPFPPLQEQDAIVAELEKQFSRLDEAVASLNRVKANLRRYVAATLRAAFTGQLVPKEAELAREHGRAFEPGSELLARLNSTRDSRKTKAAELPPTSLGRPVIEGWVWTTLGECFKVSVGATPSRKEPAYWGGSVPWVSSGEVQFSRISQTNESITDAGLANSSTQINPAGSVLLGMIGQGRTRGQVAILDIAAANNQNCAAIWVSCTPVSPEFVYYWLVSRYEQTRGEGSGNNQQALNKSLVEAIPLPLPPLAEQHRIVAELDRRLSLVREIEAQVSANLARAHVSRHAMLTRSFGGEASTESLRESASK